MVITEKFLILKPIPLASLITFIQIFAAECCSQIPLRCVSPIMKDRTPRNHTALQK